jgi:general secretion pathway protein G
MFGQMTKLSRAKHCMPRGRLAGFTIIEIMLVVALIAVLAAIALPSYQSYRERVRTAQATIDIKAIDAAIQTFRLNNGTLPDDLGAVGYGGKKDPWGNAYQYTNLSTVNGNGQARKNKNLVPINTDFDLWSNGPDGSSTNPLTASASRDDIVRANNGRFVGPAKEYDP